MLDREQNLRLRWIHIARQRYYEIHLHKDLLDDWIVHLIWGGLGTRHGGSKRKICASYADGYKLIEKIGKRREKKDYVPAASEIVM